MKNETELPATLKRIVESGDPHRLYDAMTHTRFWIRTAAEVAEMKKKNPKQKEEPK